MAGFTLHNQRIDRERLLSGLGVALVHALLAWALLTGLGVRPAALVEVPLAAFDLAPEPPVPPPPPIEEQKARAPEREGRASPPNLKSKATPVAAPTPVIVLPVPPPVVAAPIPAQGNDASSGNSNRVGPGTGSGGIGDGTGSGGYGDGPGGGGGGRQARQIRGGLGSLDCRTPETGCPSYNVDIEFLVGTDGHVTNCRVTGSSGDPFVDRETCKRIERRVLYDPARDGSGRKIAKWIGGTQEWDGAAPEPPESDDRY